jgi:hypothetical protein
MRTFPLSTADTLARHLARRDIDPNELAKSFTHLRAFIERAGGDVALQRAAVEHWWTWLEMLSGPQARTVIRSNQTRDYYETILEVCERHLGTRQPDEILYSLGWAVRLMRYYRSVPGALNKPVLFREAPSAPKPFEPMTRPPAQPSTNIPAVGAVFTGKILDVSDRGVVVELPNVAPAKALGRIQADRVGGRHYRVGNTARVEVVAVGRPTTSGRQIVELQPAPAVSTR